MKEKISDNLRVFVVPLQVLEDSNLTGNEKLIYMVLRSFANPHKAEAFPSHATIASLSSLNKRTVIRTLETLISKGYIGKEVRFNYDKEKKTARQTSNMYKLQLPECHSVTPVDNNVPSDTESPPPVTQSHSPSDTESHHEHNHLTYQLLKEEEEIKSVDDMSMSQIAFEKLIMKNKISNDVRKRIIKSLPAHIDNYSPDIILATFKKAMIKITKITDLPSWFAAAIENEKLKSDQQALLDQDYEKIKASGFYIK